MRAVKRTKGVLFRRNSLFSGSEANQDCESMIARFDLGNGFGAENRKTSRLSTSAAYSRPRANLERGCLCPATAPALAWARQFLAWLDVEAIPPGSRQPACLHVDVRRRARLARARGRALRPGRLGPRTDPGRPQRGTEAPQERDRRSESPGDVPSDSERALTGLAVWAAYPDDHSSGKRHGY